MLKNNTLIIYGIHLIKSREKIFGMMNFFVVGEVKKAE